MRRVTSRTSRLNLRLVFLSLAMGALDAAADEWIDSAWPYRVQLTVEPDSISGGATLSDFPLLVTLNSPDHDHVFSGAKSDGSDLLFTSGDGVSVLPREVVSFDPVGGSSEIWLRTDALSPASNVFFLYYGNQDTTLALTPPDAWSTDYKGVYHFEEDPGAGLLRDSSPFAKHANLDPARNWTSSDVAPGQVGQAWMFNGSTHHVASYMSAQDSSFVISAWLLNTNRSTDFFIHAQPGFWHISAQATDASRQPDYVGHGTTVRFEPNPIPINDGYHHFAFVLDHVAQTVSFYFDGELQPVHSTVPPSLNPLYLGEAINPDGNLIVGILGPRLFNQYDLMTGGGDEYRLYEGVQSGERISTEVRNQRYPDTFVDIGTEEQYGPTGVSNGVDSSLIWARAEPNPFKGRTSIEFALPASSRVELSIHNVAGRRVARIERGKLPAGRHSLHWDGRSDSGRPVAAGVYFVRLQANGLSTSAKLLLIR